MYEIGHPLKKVLGRVLLGMKTCRPGPIRADTDKNKRPEIGVYRKLNYCAGHFFALPEQILKWLRRIRRFVNVRKLRRLEHSL